MLLAPLALAGLLVPLVIYAIHWLFGTRRIIRVPAAFLWADLPQVRSGRSRRRIPPFTWLLLLQLAAASLLVLALARPTWATDAPRHVAFIVDASGSMQATDVGPTRFAAAREAALQRLAALRATDEVSLIRAGNSATLVASGSPESVKTALQAMQPGLTVPAIREALALASTRIDQSPGRSGQIVLFTDGAWAPPDSIGPLSAPVEVVPTGGGSNNQAITSLVVRMDPTGLAQTAFVEVANESDAPARISTRLQADGAPMDERRLDVAPRTRARFSVALPTDAHHVRVELASRDALNLDDALEAAAPGGPVREIDVLGPASDGLRRALESVPRTRIRTGDSNAPADLSVLSGILPPRLPAGPLLLVNPPASAGRLLGVGLGSGERVEPNHPLLQGLDLTTLQEQAPTIGGVPGWARVVFGTQAGPLIMEGTLEGHPVVCLTFDPTISGLEKSLAFPLLISNATAFLVAEAERGAIPTNTEAFDSAESDIAPRPIPAFAEAAPKAEAAPGNAEVWPWAAVASVAVLGLEWLVFARRG
jgi:hypothetical protein